MTAAVGAREDLVLLECRVVEMERQCRALLAENELLRVLLREAVGLLHDGASSTRATSTFIDKLQRFL